MDYGYLHDLMYHDLVTVFLWKKTGRSCPTHIHHLVQRIVELALYYPTPLLISQLQWNPYNVCINDDVSTIQRVVPNLIWGTDIVNLADLYFLNFKNL